MGAIDKKMERSAPPDVINGPDAII